MELQASHSKKESLILSRDINRSSYSGSDSTMTIGVNTGSSSLFSNLEPYTTNSYTLTTCNSML